jgi:hypothetical protein
MRDLQILRSKRVPDDGKRQLGHAEQLGLKARCGYKCLRHDRDGRNAALFEFN